MPKAPLAEASFALMPHGSCFFWDPVLTSLHASADTLTAVAYFSIPCLMLAHRDRASESARPLLFLFAAFILSCGVGHSLQIWNLWHSNYWLEGAWGWVTGLVSAGTAWQLGRSMPTLLHVQQDLDATRELARRDPLTSLANRRGIDRALDAALADARQGVRQSCLLLLDLDGFKQINDTYGHPAGDRLLCQVGEILKARTRSSDTVARLGGDEFAVVLVGCGEVDAKALAAAIGRDIGNLAIEAEGRPACRAVTASIGLADLDRAASAEEAYAQADRALYRAKEAGKNCTVC